MTRQALISLDLGTTRLKVAAFDPDGTLLAIKSARHQDHSAGERRWQDADHWWSDACRLLKEVLQLPGMNDREVLGVSLSGRGGAAVFVDAKGAVISNPWSDQRHSNEMQELVAWRRGGGHLSNYAAALMAKSMWLARHESQKFRQVAHVLYAKDFLMLRLTGEAVTDPTSSADNERWDENAVLEAGLRPDQLPRIANPWEIGGTLSAEAAAATGLPNGTPVAVGGHDGICANIGAGAGTPGTYAITLGTHAVVRTVTTAAPDGAYRFYGLPPNLHVIGGNAVMGGRAADWFLDTWTDSDEATRQKTFQEMDAEADRVAPGSDGILFLPFLAGQVAPEARPGASAVFAGMHSRHRRGDLYRAVLEGGAFAVRAIFDQIVQWCGEPELLRLTGSGAQSEVWSQIIADVLNRRIEVSDEAVEARGAALYLAVALGLHANTEIAAAAMVPITATRLPQPDVAKAYADIYRQWQALSDATRPLDRKQ